MAKITEYQRGYLDGLKDKPKTRAAALMREIKPELLDYPTAMRNKKTAYASPIEWEKLREFFNGAKKDSCEIITVAFPEVFGDNYMDVIARLSLLAEYGFLIGIAKKSPFLIEWAEHFPIFEVPEK